MTSAVRSLFARHRPAAHAARHTVHQRHGRSAHFFRGVLIGLAILMVISLVIG
jgi:tetrahydromethanopterin S-methyltransferase subunit B